MKIWEITEKTLTPAELKKREEIAQAIEKDQPGIDMSKKMAIATAQAKKITEAYGDTKYSLGNGDPDLKKKAMDSHKERLAELNKKLKDAEDSGDDEAAEKHEKAIKLHKAMMANTHTYVKG